MSGSNDAHKKGKKKRNVVSVARGAILPPPPPAQGISCNPSSITLSTGGSNISAGTPQSFVPPPFVSVNVRKEAFLNDDTDNEYNCSYCHESYMACPYEQGYQKNPSLPYPVCKHRFCQECVVNMNGSKNCPVDNCLETNGEVLFKLDRELCRRIIMKSCKELDSEAELNKDDITNDEAGIRLPNQLLTSG